MVEFNGSKSVFFFKVVRHNNESRALDSRRTVTRLQVVIYNSCSIRRIDFPLKYVSHKIETIRIA